MSLGFDFRLTRLYDRAFSTRPCCDFGQIQTIRHILEEEEIDKKMDTELHQVVQIISGFWYSSTTAAGTCWRNPTRLMYAEQITRNIASNPKLPLYEHIMAYAPKNLDTRLPIRDLEFPTECISEV